MIIWLDAHLSPSIARWIAETFAVDCASARDLGLRDALDPPIFAAARAAGATVMTKDADFAISNNGGATWPTAARYLALMRQYIQRRVERSPYSRVPGVRCEVGGW